MRISTGQMFHQNTHNILSRQSDTNKVMQQIASGKKVNTSGDDPVAAIGINNLKQKNALIDQFQKNIDYATNRLGLTETKFSSVEKLTTSMRETLVRGANGSLSAVERQMVADDLRASLDELLSLANTQDESGNYLFSGHKTNSKPFEFDATGKIIYRGDSGVRNSNVAPDVKIGTNIPGDLAFMNAPNPMGDYGVSYQAGQQGSFKVTSAQIANSLTHIEDDYTFSFVAGTPNPGLQVTDSSGSIVANIASFDPSVPVAFNGIEVKLEGNPQVGDSFSMTPQDTVSIFDTFNQAIALLESPEGTNTPDGASKLAQLLNDIDSSQNQVSTARSITGNSLKAIDSIVSNHDEEKLINTAALSKLEDLDMAEAITEFEKHQLALNAVSSVFGRVGSLSLFDYI